MVLKTLCYIYLSRKAHLFQEQGVVGSEINGISQSFLCCANVVQVSKRITANYLVYR